MAHHGTLTGISAVVLLCFSTAAPAQSADTPDDTFWAPSAFSNTGPEVTLYANGDRVPSRLPGGMLSFPSGTSMATPMVANAAAKMLAVNPHLTGAELRTLLEQTATVNATGQRLLHAKRAVAAASNRVAANNSFEPKPLRGSA